jgi:GNAT superfamily N-acetyltransferase
MLIGSFQGDVGCLYQLWENASRERPWETKMDVNRFVDKYLDGPFQKNGFVILASEDETNLGTALTALSPEMRRGWLRLWVPPEHRGRRVGSLLIEHTIKRMKSMGKWRLECEPVPFCPGYNAFFKANGFKSDLDYPGGYLMRRGINVKPEPSVAKGCEIVRVSDIEKSGYFDKVADVEIGYSGGQKIDLEERKMEMLASMADSKSQCYSLAVQEERILGFSRSAIVENVAGELQLRNRGLIVSTEARGGGIGRALLDDNLAWGYGEGVRVAYISTHSANPAKRLYERAGYAVVETLENLVYKVG